MSMGESPPRPRGATAILDEVFEDPAPIERALVELVHLHALTTALTTARTGREVATAVFDKALAVQGARGCYLGWLVTDDHVETVDLRGYPPEVAERFRRLPRDAEHGVSIVARTGEPLFLSGPEAIEARSPAAWELARAHGDRAYAGLPILVGGRVRGVLGVAFPEPRTFDDHDRRYLMSVAGQAGQALERVRADESERRARADAEALARRHAETAALLDVLLDTAPVGLGYWDRELRWRRVNEALAEMNGLPAPAHIGRRPHEVVPDLEDIADIEDGLRRVMDTGEPILDVEVSGQTPAVLGRTRHWVQSWYPVRVGDGEIIGAGAVIREVTEEKAAEAFRRRVLGVVGHDLRTPLSVVRVGLEVLRSTEDPAEREHLVDRLAASVRRMAEMTDALLDYDRFSAGETVVLHRRPVDLAVLCGQILRELEAAHAGRIVHRSVQPCVGRWDPGRLGQVISNLLTNALQHGTADGPVTVETGPGPGCGRLSVHNGGPPIPRDMLPRVFEPFRRGPATEVPGQGLGLYIVREIVSAHGGEVEVRSSPEEGTTFEVRLPVG